MGAKNPRSRKSGGTQDRISTLRARSEQVRTSEGDRTGYANRGAILPDSWLARNVNPARRVRNLLGIYSPAGPVLVYVRHDCKLITLKSLVEPGKKTAPPERGKLGAVPGKEAPIGVRQRMRGSRDSQKKEAAFSGHPCSPCRQGV
jgi:hypothetical protein